METNEDKSVQKTPKRKLPAKKPVAKTVKKTPVKKLPAKKPVAKTVKKTPVKKLPAKKPVAKTVKKTPVKRDKVKKPKFQRQESWRYKRLETSWRRPRGFDSKMRIQKKGWPPIVNIGYGGPKTQRGLHPSGYRDILIHSVKDLANINPEIDAIRISAKIGRRYKQEIVTQADSFGIKVLNRSITKRKK